MCADQGTGRSICLHSHIGCRHTLKVQLCSSLLRLGVLFGVVVSKGIGNLHCGSHIDHHFDMAAVCMR